MQQYSFEHYQHTILQRIASIKTGLGICTTPTTTLLINTPIDVRRLEARYKLIRYELPTKFYQLVKRSRHAYGQMHNKLRDQLNCPYKTFKYDRLDGMQKWVVYALYPRHAMPVTLEMSFLSDIPLPASEIALDQLDPQLLLQLLQIAHCCSEQRERFVGQDQCYVPVKKDGNSSYFCLHIDLQGEACIEDDIQDFQEFKVVAQACWLHRVIAPLKMHSQKHSHSSAYFAQKESKNKSNFCYLGKAEIEAYQYRKEPLYTMCAGEEMQTSFSYQDLHYIEGSIGKLLDDFIRDFSMYLATYGIMCHSKERHFTRFVPPDPQQLQLPLSLLNPIAVFDNRLSRTYPLQDYLDVLAQHTPTLLFKAITNLSEVHADDVLIIQDYIQEDFEQQGVLNGQDTPLHELSQQYPHAPIQSINVNSNTSAGKTAQTYLDYNSTDMDDQDFKSKVEVAIAQLYLQDVISYQRSAQERLPLMSDGLIFIRKKCYNPQQSPHETLLYVENDTLHFLDLRDPAQRLLRNDLLARLGIDWQATYEQMCCKYHLTEEQHDKKEPPCYDVIAGPDLFVELEDLNERVLYNYDDMVRRQTSMSIALPVEEFKLLRHYDTICTTDCLPLSALVHRGLLEAHACPKNRREEVSLKFYRQLEAYDAFLDNVQRSIPTISYNSLIQGWYWEKIIHIFNLHPEKNGYHARSQFKGYYQRRGWFSSDQEKALPMYEGIWYDDTHSYLIGPAQLPEQQQPHAHILRRFHIYQGEEHFDMSPLLLAAGVQALNLNRYQAYPYAFHLIDLYVTNHYGASTMDNTQQTINQRHPFTAPAVNPAVI
jgi:hypothetical protein